MPAKAPVSTLLPPLYDMFALDGYSLFIFFINVPGVWPSYAAIGIYEEPVATCDVTLGVDGLFTLPPPLLVVRYVCTC